MENVKGKSKNEAAFVQHAGKVAISDGCFKHIMAIALDPTSKYKKGVVRCIVSREGDIGTSGYVDRSEIHKISGNLPECFLIGENMLVGIMNGRVANEMVGDIRCIPSR